MSTTSLPRDRPWTTWRNPLGDETVKVVHLANDPVNHVIREWLSPPPVDRAAAAMKIEKRPLQYAWRVQDDRLLMSRHVHLFYPNALDPKVWVRESSGPMVQASEFTSWNMSLDDMQDASLTSIDSVGNWSRVTPWLPWMLMGTAPGHCLYETFISKVTPLRAGARGHPCRCGDALPAVPGVAGEIRRGLRLEPRELREDATSRRRPRAR